MSSAATSKVSRPSNLVFHSDTSACGGEVYPAYEYEQSGYVLNNEEKSHSRLDIIKMPSYEPIGDVVSQWPVGCVAVFGNHFTTYLFVSSGPLTSDREILPLAKNRPVRPECLTAVTPTTDGNAYPLTCSNGEVNVAAWESYATLLPRLLTLGRTVTRCQVYEAEVAPALSSEENLTYPETFASYQLASAYYGWSLNIPYPASTKTSWEKRCTTSHGITA
jgi:hypothetical protein